MNSIMDCALENRLLVERKRRGKRSPPIEEFSPSTIRCRTRLGGLLKHYYRAAA